jgi:uncharacterized protein (TIGR02145 family)
MHFLAGFFGTKHNELTDSVIKPDNDTVTDIDGNVYHTVAIGTQVWMLEDLKTLRYRNGEAIPDVRDPTTWMDLASGACYWYNRDATDRSAYKVLYNWYAVNDRRKIAPKGWHVPTDAEWTRLIEFLGGEEVAGGKLKEKGTSHWEDPNTGATNETGFTAVPGGFYCIYGLDSARSSGHWWTSTEYDKNDARSRKMSWRESSVGIGKRGLHSKSLGKSVRCLRD